MKLQIIILLGTVLIFCAGSVAAQSDADAKDLYYGYKPRPQKREKVKITRKTTTTTRTTVETQTTTTVSTRKKTTQPGASKPPTIAVKNKPRRTLPATTGLPGTKITIELLRGEQSMFVGPGFKFRSGDKIRLRMKTNFEGYVTVLNLGSSGAVNLLYPRGSDDNYVLPTTEFYQIPQGNNWIVFDDQPGAEIVSVIMSEDPLEGLESLDRNSDYFNKDRTGKDLFIQSTETDFYAVFRPQQTEKNVGFLLRLKHD